MIRAAAAARAGRRALLGLAAFPAAACAQGSVSRTSPAPAPVDTAALHHTLDSLARAHHGVVGYAVREVDGDVHLSLRGDETFPTASLIKVAILVTLYDAAEKKLISLDEPVTLLDIDQVPGSGVLQYLHSGLVLSVRDAAQLMTMLSDNTGTNLVLQKIGIRRVWATMDSLGLHDTRVFAEVFRRDLTSVAPDSSAKYGLGKTTPNEMSQLFVDLAHGKAVSPAADSAMLAMLETNDDFQMLQRYLDGVRAAHKTGADDAVRTECTLWYLRARVVACVLTKQNTDQRWVLDNEPQRLMGAMGAAIARAFGLTSDEHVAIP